MSSGHRDELSNEYPARHGAKPDREPNHAAPYNEDRVRAALERSRTHLARHGTTKPPYAHAVDAPNRSGRVPVPGDIGRTP